MAGGSFRYGPPLAAAGLLLATIAPYLYLQTQSGWSDVLGIAKYLAKPKVFGLDALALAAGMAGPSMFGSMLPGPGGVAAAYAGPLLNTLLIGLGLIGLATITRPPRGARAIVGAWLVLPVVSALRHSGAVVPHYLLAILPAIVLLQALALDEIWTLVLRLGQRWKRLSPARWVGGLTAVSAAAVAGWLAVDYASFQQAVAGNVRQVEYGMPLRYSLSAADLVRKTTAGQPLYVAVPFLYNQTVPALAGRQSYQWYWDRSVLVFPRTAAWYLVQNDSFGHAFLTDHFGPPQATVPGSAGRPEFSLFHLPENAQDELFQGPSFTPLQADLGQAIRMRGYLSGQLAAGQTSQVLLLWQVTDPVQIPNHVTEFAHLVDDTGKTVSSDPDLWDVFEPWRTGDMVAAAFDLNIKPGTPAGGYWLETGFYGTFDQRQLTLAQGGAALRVGPLKVAAPNQEAAASQPPLATLGNGEVGLLGARWQGQDVAVDWTALAKPLGSYTVFVHAVDSSGKVVAQWDGAPRNGSYPTSLWDAGEVVHDVYPIGQTPGPGNRLEIGMYTQPDVKRLPVHTLPSGPVADHITLPADSSRAPHGS